MKYFLFILLVCAAGCSSETDADLWQRVMSAKANQNWDSTRMVCQKILREYPSGKYAPWARFGLAESYRFSNEPRNALNNYKLFYTTYPDMKQAELSLFLVGFIYNNDLHMFDSSKYYYTLFLKKFPQSDLVPSVNVELGTLGKAPDQILSEQRHKYAKKE